MAMTPRKDPRLPLADIPWREIAEIGNVLRHDYDGVRAEILWNMRVNRLEPLKQAVGRLVDRGPSNIRKRGHDNGVEI